MGYWTNTERLVVESDSARHLWQSLIYDRRSHFWELSVPEYRLILGNKTYIIPGADSPLLNFLNYEEPVSVRGYNALKRFHLPTLQAIGGAIISGERVPWMYGIQAASEVFILLHKYAGLTETALDEAWEPLGYSRSWKAFL